jgi:23S rRNA pseudouridine955/2504/2580 synthase
MNGLICLELRAGADDDGRRLDRILRKALPDLPLSGVYRLLRQKRALVNGLPAKADARVRSGQTIRLEGFIHDGGGRVPPDGLRAAPAKKPLRIIWEGAGILALDKETGICVHGPDSLDEQARAYLERKLPASLSFKPGPLHRLDRPSSGVVVFSTSLEGARIFSTLLRARLLKKRYLALVDGKIEEAAFWEETLVRDTRRKKTGASPAAQSPGRRGKTARTRVFPLAAGDAYSLVLFEIETGRTHQIRSQAAFHGHPLAGDRKYGGSFLEGGLLLHALSLEFPPQPVDTGEEGAAGAGWDALWGKKLCAALPGAFLAQIQRIFGKKIPKFIVT